MDLLKTARSLKHQLRRLTFSKAERRHDLVGVGKVWKMKRDFQIRFLLDHGLEPQHYLLDIGCGTMRGGIPCIEHLDAGHYFGIDVREIAIEEGRKEIEESGVADKKPRLSWASNILDHEIDQDFDFMWAFTVLFHMEDAILHDTLKVVAQRLKQAGTFFANVHIGEAPEGDWLEFPIVHRSWEFYQSACEAQGLTIEDIGPLHALGHVSGNESQDNQQMMRISHG